MNRKALEALKHINELGLYNHEWGIVENVRRSHFVKTDEEADKMYRGVWLYVWLSAEEARKFEKESTEADNTIMLEDYNETILQYKLEK